LQKFELTAGQLNEEPLSPTNRSTNFESDGASQETVNPALAQRIHDAENYSPRSSFSLDPNQSGYPHSGDHSVDLLKDNYKGFHARRTAVNIPPLQHPIKPRFKKKSTSLLGKLIYSKKDDHGSHHNSVSSAGDEHNEDSHGHKNSRSSDHFEPSFLHRHSTKSEAEGFLHRHSSPSTKPRTGSTSRHNSATSASISQRPSTVSSNSSNSVGGSGYVSDTHQANNADRAASKSIANAFDLDINEMQGIVKSPQVKTNDVKVHDVVDGLTLPSWQAPESWDVKLLKRSDGNDQIENIDELISENDKETPETSVFLKLPLLYGFKASHLVNPGEKSNHIIRVFREDNTFTTILCSMETTTAELLKIVQRKFFLESTSNFQITVYVGNNIKVLEPFEKPLKVQNGLLRLSGYQPDSDNLKILGREDISFICKFVMETISLRGLTHDEEVELSKDYVDVNMSGLDLKNIPIIFHQHTYEIEKLNVAHNPSIYIPLDFVQSCNNLMSVNFASNGASRFPMNFLEAPKLTHLNMEKNFLDELPVKISQLSNLTNLKLNSNQLTNLPKSFSTLINLVNLNLSSNYFHVYPEQISDLVNLRDLDLSYNDLSEVPESITKLVNLQKLNLCTNKLSKTLPEYISKLTALKRMDIRYNQITNVDVLGNLPSLEVAYASKNNISSFSDKMKSLRLLHFDRNPITNLHFTNLLDLLTILDLSKAKITSIPPEFISRIPNIEKFVLDKNHLVTLPEEIGNLPKLTVLSLYGNNLLSLPASISKLSTLQFLDLHSNNLQLLPDGIWKLKSLSVLNVSSNILSSFPKPPLSLAKRISASFNSRNLQNQQNNDPNTFVESSYTALPSVGQAEMDEETDVDGRSGKSASLADSLLSITLTDNRLGDDCFESISFLINLKLLNLSYNELLEIPEGALRRFVDLVELYLSGNELTALPVDDLESLRSLKSLYLNGNKFVTLPAEISKLQKLQHLDVGSNQLKYNIANWPYDWNWQWNKNLRSLDFSGNKRFEIKQSHQKNPETGDYLDSLLVLQNLRVLGLIDVTITTGSVPDPNSDLRIRTTGSEMSNIGYGVADFMGTRENISSGDMFIQKFRGNENEVLYISLDGKGGPATHGHKILHLCKEMFVPTFIAELSKIKSDNEIKDAIRRTFLSLNKEINGILAAKKSHHFTPSPQLHPGLSDLTLQDDSKAGCSISMVYIKDKRLFAANIGDIEMILTRSNGEHIRLSNKHDPTNRTEFEVIRAGGGYVSGDGNLDGELSVSRGVGYFNYIPHTNSGPDITEIPIYSSDDTIVIGSKTLWDHIQYELAVDILRQEKEDPMLAAQRLRDYTIAYGNADKVFASVITLGEKKSRGRFGSNALYNNIGETDVFGAKKRRTAGAAAGDSTLSRLDDEIDPPVDTLALVFTDIKSSTWLWDTFPVPMRSAIKIHNTIMRRQLRIVGGYEVKTEGDAFMVAFPTPTSALLWCFNVQQALLTADWPSEILETDQCCEVADTNNNVIFRGLSVRMGIHWGSPVCEPDVVTGRMDYFGPMVNRASRISATADGGQIAVSSDFLDEMNTLVKLHQDSLAGVKDVHIDEIVAKELKSIEEIGVEYYSLGERKLKGLETPENITLAFAEGLKLRMELFEKRLKSQDDQTRHPSSTRVVGAIPVEAIYGLKAISLRLENICSSMDVGTLIQEPFINPLMDVEFQDSDLLGLLNHLVVRIEQCITALFLRQQLEIINENSGLIDFTKSKPASEIMTELHEIFTLFQQLKTQTKIQST